MSLDPSQDPGEQPGAAVPEGDRPVVPSAETSLGSLAG